MAFGRCGSSKEKSIKGDVQEARQRTRAIYTERTRYNKLCIQAGIDEILDEVRIP